jgi:hypothetical protein
MQPELTDPTLCLKDVGSIPIDLDASMRRL